QSLFWDQKTQVEVARMLSLSQSTVSQLKRRALEQLRRLMGWSEKGIHRKNRPIKRWSPCILIYGGRRLWTVPVTGQESVSDRSRCLACPSFLGPAIRFSKGSRNRSLALTRAKIAEEPPIVRTNFRARPGERPACGLSRKELPMRLRC